MNVGAFGKVFKGVFYLPDDTDLVVAIKTIKSESFGSPWPELMINGHLYSF